MNTNRLTSLFVPRYNALSLFLMSFAFGLLFMTHADLRAGVHFVFFDDFDPRRVLAFVGSSLGFLYSLFLVFSTRPKTDKEKGLMLCFAIIVNGFGGIAAGLHMLGSSSGILIVFPLWNMINGAMLLLLFRLKVIDEDCIGDESATFVQVIFGGVVVVAVFLVCSFALELHWAITFSICVAYASHVGKITNIVLNRFLSEAVDGLMGGLLSGDEKHSNTIESCLKSNSRVFLLVR